MRKWPSRSICLASLVAVIGTGSVVWAGSHHKNVELAVDGRISVVANPPAQTVGDLLHFKKIALASTTHLDPAAATPLSNGMIVRVEHGSHIQLVDGTDARWLRTSATTVGQMLTEQGIKLGAHDILNVSQSTVIVPSLKVVIVRESEEQVVAKQELPFDTVRQADDSAYKGEERIVSNGQSGEEKITTTTVYRNGRRILHEVANEVVTKPVNKVVAYGTQDRPVVVASRSSSGPFSGNQITVVATAYTGGGRTATGAPAGHGCIAVDPRVIPLGTKIYVPGYGYGVANDVGGAIQGNRIDLCFNSEAEAIAFGRQQITISIVSQ